MRTSPFALRAPVGLLGPLGLHALPLAALVAALVVTGCGGSHRKPVGPPPEYEEPEAKLPIPSSQPAPAASHAGGLVGDGGRD